MSRLVLLLLVVVTSACAHTIEFRSDPPGADVVVDGERVGKTPMQWTEPLGDEGVYDVEIRHGGRTQHVTLKKEGWSVPTVATVAGACVGSSMAMVLVGATFWIAGVALFVPTLGIATLVLAPIAVVAALSGAIAFWPAVITTGAVSWLFGRIGPDIVFADFANDKTTAQPPALMGPPLKASHPPRREDPNAPGLPEAGFDY